MEIRLERMSIHEIRKSINGQSLVFLPIAPLEWHSYHLPYGTDPLNAEAFAIELAKNLEGTVHPTLYMGTEVSRRTEEKEWFGLEDVDKEVIGMDLPGFEIKSMYWSPEVFKIATREAVLRLKKLGFRTIVIVNGHGADKHQSILKKIANDLSDNSVKVLYFISLWDEEGAWTNNNLPRWEVVMGHADRVETSIVMYEHPELVNLERLPAKGKLIYKDFGIIEGKAFRGEPAEDYCCRESSDPRKSNIKEGAKIFKKTLKAIQEIIGEELNNRRGESNL